MPKLLAAPLLAVALLGGLVTVAEGPTAAAAGVKSTSPSVASAAGRALEAYGQWAFSDDPTAYVRYLAVRDQVAERAASELGVDATALRVAWGTTDQSKQLAVLAALTQLGVPYRSMASIEGVGFDCSGLTRYAWGRAGLALERNSRSQINDARHVSRDEAEAGDLVFYPGHVMMYLGVGDAIVHSPNSGNHVEITFLNSRRSGSVRFGDPTG